MSNLTTQVRAAIETVRTYRGKKIARICGRSASNLAQVEQAALLEGMTQEEFDSLVESDQAPPASGDPSGSNAAPYTQLSTPLEGKPQHETSTIRLDPGSAVLRTDGLLPIVIGSFGAAPGEGGQPAPTWCASGEFVLFLEAGEDEHANLVRELLVGPYREFNDTSDHELTPGNFLTDPEWDFVVGEPRTHVMQLVQEIGFDPEVERPDESKPRGESWLAERASADAEKQRMDAELSALKEQLAAANARTSELEAELTATPADSPVSSALPENALDLLNGIKGVGDKLAAEILSVLKGQE